MEEKYQLQLTSKTNFLLGGNNIGPSKIEKAKSIGLSIISENDLSNLIESKLL